jgi:hypothetical protein
MTKMDRVLKKLSELYDFNRRLKTYKLKETANKSLEEDATKHRRAPKKTTGTGLDRR